jgi:predicted amidophosphoribosyltransferase
MNGRDLTLGALAGLAVAGLVAQRRGSRIMLQPQRVSARVTPVIVAGPYSALRELAYRVKGKGVPDKVIYLATEEAAARIVAAIPEEIDGASMVLVPVPDSTGRTDVSGELAQRIAESIGAEVMDVLRSKPRLSTRQKKVSGQPQLLARDMPMTLAGFDPDDLAGRDIYLVDNVIDTGATLRAAQAAFGRNIRALALAVTDGNNPRAQAAWQTQRFDSPWFRRWFGSSTVVNADGTPQVVYHGTRGVFDALSLRARPRTKGGTVDRAEGGAVLYFSTNPEAASGYAEDGSVMPVFLRVERPLVIDTQGKTWGEYTDMVRDQREAYWDAVRRGRTPEHDGILFRGTIETIAWFESHLSDTYVVFDPRQVKSATGNRGTFNPEDSRLSLNRVIV